MKKLSKSILFLVTLTVLFSVGCSSTKVAETTIAPELILQEIKDTQTPIVKEEPVITPVVKEEPKVESVVAEPVVVKEEPKKVEFKYDYFFEYGGYRIDIVVHNGYGYVTYPTIISTNDLLEAAAAFTKAHGDMGVVFDIAKPGKLNVTFPENLSKADLDYVANLAATDLTWYLDQKFAKVEEPKVEPKAEPVVVKEEPKKVEFKYDYFFEYGGYRIDIEVHNGYGYVTYPTIISTNDLIEAAAAFTKAHGDMGVVFDIAKPGKLNVTFPENLSKADLDYVANLAATDLSWYLDQKFAKVEEPKVEPKVEPVVAEPVVVEEKPVKAEPVVEQPVVVQEEPKKVEPAPVVAQPVVEKPAAPVSTPEPVVVEEKGMSAFSIVLIILLFVVLGAACYYFLIFKKKK